MLFLEGPWHGGLLYTFVFPMLLFYVSGGVVVGEERRGWRGDNDQKGRRVKCKKKKKKTPTF